MIALTIIARGEAASTATVVIRRDGLPLHSHDAVPANVTLAGVDEERALQSASRRTLREVRTGTHFRRSDAGLQAAATGGQSPQVIYGGPQEVEGRREEPG